VVFLIVYLNSVFDVLNNKKNKIKKKKSLI
jgi:hypothetical protein